MSISTLTLLRSTAYKTHEFVQEKNVGNDICNIPGNNGLQKLSNLYNFLVLSLLFLYDNKIQEVFNRKFHESKSTALRYSFLHNCMEGGGISRRVDVFLNFNKVEGW